MLKIMFDVKQLLLLFFLFFWSIFASEDEGLLIGAFNVRVFGQSKMRTPARVEVLEKVLSRYDIVLVQEIRDSKETAFKKLVSIINSKHNNQFDFVTGRRVGRTSSKEQYGFIFRNDKLMIKSEYEDNDKNDLFEREPHVVRFRRIDNKGIVKEFTMIPMHAKPKDAINEMNYLVDVYTRSENVYGPNAIIAGDLNADCKYVCQSCWNRVKLRMEHRFKWIIPDSADTTTTRTDCAYDRLGYNVTSIPNPECLEIIHFTSTSDRPTEPKKKLSYSS